jgi:hypothetical protein
MPQPQPNPLDRVEARAAIARPADIGSPTCNHEVKLTVYNLAVQD